MAKSILIINTPERCSECPLCEGDTMDGLCHGASAWFDDEHFTWYQYQEDDIDESKPANCPLKDFPERITAGNVPDSNWSGFWKDNYANGWNACVDAIGGDGDEP